MQKVLSIRSTALPTGEIIVWENNMMPVHKYYAMDSQLFNRWATYIRNQTNKSWNLNKVRPGGLNYKDYQSQVLDMAKEILSK